jgi:hypothetical protein
VKKYSPKRAFSFGRRSTRSTTLASSPIPEPKVKCRPFISPVSTLRGSNSSAMRRRCSVASTTSLGMPSTRQKTLVEPPGRHVRGVSRPTRPFAASLTVPSPPKATTTS